MSDALIDAIRRVNPHPAELPGPPIAPVLRRLQESAGAARSPRRARTLRPTVGGAIAVLSIALAVGVAVVAVVTLRHARTIAPGAQRTGGTVGAAGAACRPEVRDQVLPVWARAGFSEARPRMPFELGTAGLIGAIVWAPQLDSPPSATHSNKILWVARTPDESAWLLTITAQRMSGTQRLGAPVRRSVAGGPGPSIINLPEAGCWRFTLRWAGKTDLLDLRYRRLS
jgi:hypothetical protein